MLIKFTERPPMTQEELKELKRLLEKAHQTTKVHCEAKELFVAEDDKGELVLMVDAYYNVNAVVDHLIFSDGGQIISQTTESVYTQN